MDKKQPSRTYTLRDYSEFTDAVDSPNIQLMLEKFFEIVCIILIIITFPLAIFLCVEIIPEFERAIVLRFGRSHRGVRGPGVVLLIPCIDECFSFDLRTDMFDVAPQEILTRDSVTVKVDAVVYYRVQIPMLTMLHVVDYKNNTMLLGQTMLRNVAGQRMLSDLVTQKDEVAQTLETLLDEGTDDWGIKVERVEIKDVCLPTNLQRAMAAAAEATREAKAKIVAAGGEKSAANSLRAAADIISTNPVALQLRYLQTLTTISAEKNSSIVFPYPVNLIKPNQKHLPETGLLTAQSEANQGPISLSDHDFSNNMFGYM